MSKDYPYSLTPGGFRSARSLIGEKTDQSADLHILVAGAQFGELSLRIAEFYGCRVTGIEADPEAVVYAKMMAGSVPHGKTTDFRFMEPDKTAFEDCAFDIVLADNIFAMYPLRKTLTEFRRILKPDGILGVMDSYWLKTPVPTYVSEVWETKDNPVLTDEEWNAAVTECGFVPEEFIDNSRMLNRFYDQFKGDLKDIAASGFEGLKHRKSLVKHFKHEIDVYRKNGGNKYMGHLLLRARPARSAEA